jgi:hypothetical protein
MGMAVSLVRIRRAHRPENLNRGRGSAQAPQGRAAPEGEVDRSIGARSPADKKRMRSWVFRNRALLETVYGVPGRPRPLTEPLHAEARGAGAREPEERLVLYHLRPLPRRDGLRRAG